MKQLLLSVDLAHVEGINVSDVVGSSLNEQVEKLLSYAEDDDSWIDDNIKELLHRCNALMKHHVMCEEDEKSRGEKKVNADLKSLLMEAQHLSKQDDPTYVPRRGIDTRFSLNARGMSVPRYEVIKRVEEEDRTTQYPFDIESIASMVDPSVSGPS